MGGIGETGVGDEREHAAEGFLEHREVVCAEEDCVSQADFDGLEAEWCHLGLDLVPPF